MVTYILQLFTRGVKERNNIPDFKVQGVQKKEEAVSKVLCETLPPCGTSCENSVISV
jgi:hypothetical protein